MLQATYKITFPKVIFGKKSLKLNQYKKLIYLHLLFGLQTFQILLDSDSKILLYSLDPYLQMAISLELYNGMTATKTK